MTTNQFVMPIRWNEEQMSPLDVLHKQLQMQFMWSDKFINEGDVQMFYKCQNDITKIKLLIRKLKEENKQQFNNKQKQFKNKN
jgi:hypothetical protein